jgi:hypothetical protein
LTCACAHQINAIQPYIEYPLLNIEQQNKEPQNDEVIAAGRVARPTP